MDQVTSMDFKGMEPKGYPSRRARLENSLHKYAKDNKMAVVDYGETVKLAVDGLKDSYSDFSALETDFRTLLQKNNADIVEKDVRRLLDVITQNALVNLDTV